MIIDGKRLAVTIYHHPELGRYGYERIQLPRNVLTYAADPSQPPFDTSYYSLNGWRRVTWEKVPEVWREWFRRELAHCF